jgi:hypothetical protein
VATLLVLVVFPEDLVKDSSGSFGHVDEGPIKAMAEKGWPEWQQNLQRAETLDELAYRLRNALAHYYVQFDSNSLDPEQVTVHFEDWNPETHQREWAASIRADKLLDFAYQLSGFLQSRLID